MLNCLTAVGRLVKDVQVKKSKTGKSVADFTIATQRETKEKEADYIDCEAWGSAADFLGLYAKKGTLLSIKGRLQSRSYEGRDGHMVYVKYVLIESVNILAGGKSKDEAQQYSQDVYDEPSIEIGEEDLPF